MGTRFEDILQLVEQFDEPNQASAETDEDILQWEKQKKPKQAEIASPQAELERRDQSQTRLN